MIRLIKCLLILIILLVATTQTPLVHAQGGLVFNPYWTFTTNTPVTHVETGDVNGDGVREVVFVTEDDWVYVLKNDGSLAWRYEAEFDVGEMSVAELDGDQETEEIIIAGPLSVVFLRQNGEKTTCAGTQSVRKNTTIAAVDLNGDGNRELIFGIDTGIVITPKCELITNSFWGAMSHPPVAIWAGDIDGDGQPEIAPNPAGGHWVYLYEDSEIPVWKNRLEAEVGLVQGGDVDGDGRAEIVVLTTTGDLLLFEGDGSQVWQKKALRLDDASAELIPGQLAVHDLDGDSRAEIIMMASLPVATVQVFDGEGERVWERPLEAITSPARLAIDDLDNDRRAEIVVTTTGQEQVYLLSGSGQPLAEYRTTQTTGALHYADLNGDGRGEIILGVETGVQVFGSAPRAVWKELWQSPHLGSVAALDFVDFNDDGQDELVVGTGDPRLYALTNEGHILWETNLVSPVWALGVGDIDGNGRPEIVTAGGGQLHVFSGSQFLWSVPIGEKFSSGVAIRDIDGDHQAEIIVGSNSSSGSAVDVFNGAQKLIWRQAFSQNVVAVDSHGETILVATDGGRIYRLKADGSLAGEYNLEANVLSFDQGLVTTVTGQIYRLDDNGVTFVRDLDQIPQKVQMSPGPTIILNRNWEVGVVTTRDSTWQNLVEVKAINIAAGDLNRDGMVEIAVGTDGGRVQLMGLTLDQIPFLTNPRLAETRTGYAYSVNVNDPEGDAVAVTLEVWDPSASVWLTQAVQSVSGGQGQLTWDVSDPFDTWDSGRESRFRFVYDDGGEQQITPEISGPLTIPTTPWYIYFGQRAGLAALILLVPALGLALYRRQRQYRQSPQGRAESLLKQLQAQPEQTLTRLHVVANDAAALLTYLPPLARQAQARAIAEVSERLNLLLVQPEVTAESVRAFIEAVKGLEKAPPETKKGLLDTFNLFRQALEANTVNRIVVLSPRLNQRLATAPDEMGEALAEMNQVIKTLTNFQRVEYSEDKTAYLAQALEALSRLEQGFQPDARPPKLYQPERNVLRSIAAHWRAVVNNALQDLHGRAQINVVLKTRQLLSLNNTALSLELTNSGRSPASNLVVSLAPDQPFAVLNGAVKLDILPAGRSATVEVPISAAASVEQFRAEFSISYDDREGEGKAFAFADMVYLLKPDTEFQSIANPYAPGTPLAPGSPIFFGREDLFQFISENIAGLSRQNILVLIGQRRMGKTSFLQQLPARLGEAYLPVYIDGQSLGIDPGMANFFYDLSLAIVDGLAEQDIDLEEPEPEDFEARPSTTFERIFLPTVFQAIGQRQLLLLFDEFEELEMRVTSGKLEATIFPFFRHLMQHQPQLGFIFVGTHRLEALSSDYWSIFFNIALYKHVAFLDETAARALITEPVTGYGLIYDDLALDKMLRVTAGHPYFLQLTCHALVNRANRARRNYLTIQDVNNVLNEMVELGEAHFAFLWEQASSAEQLILAALTRLLGQEATVTATQVNELLAERGVTIVLSEITDILRALNARDVVREITGQPPRYEYKIELVRLWVERYKTLGRVVEELA